MNQKIKACPPPATARVEKFSHDGRGIARIEGKATFIQNSLPTEEVMFQYTRRKRDYDEGQAVTVLNASPSRVEPRCPHYQVCGGCSLQHLESSAQIQYKEEQLLDILRRVGHCYPQEVLPPLRSEVWHYRNKARLSARYVEKKHATLVGFREKNNPRYIAEIEQCPVLNARVDSEIILLRELIDALHDPRCIAQIEVAVGDDEVALILRNLSPLQPTDEAKLSEYADRTGFRLFLQPAGPDSVHLLYPQTAGDLLQYALPEHGVRFQFHPTDFTQVNGGLNRLMVSQAIQLLQLTTDDCVLDLFCGLGNFSLPMAKYCHKVVGVEGSETMVQRARDNAALNGLDNTQFFCADLQKPDELKSFWSNIYTKIVLDPPRTGALDMVKRLDTLAPQRIVYISCNPATLARDADVLVNQHGYRMVAAGVMDMFPHTAHVESIAVFE